jgi:hypothetical protein
MKLRTKQIALFVLLVGTFGFQSFTMVDCFQQFNRDMNDAHTAYEKDVQRCRWAIPPGLCMPEAELSYDKAIDKAEKAFNSCLE